MVCTAAMACFVASDGDLGFHLATGREILRTGHIPATNVLSFSEPMQPWRLHQWLPGVLFELVFRSVGIAGVIALKMAVVSATWGAVYGTARKLGATAMAATFACVIAAMASSFRFESRPYLFTHWTLALSMYCLASYLDAAHRRLGAREEMRALFVLVLIATAAAHLHAGSIDSLIVIVIAAMGCALEPLRARVLRAGDGAQLPHGVRAAGTLLLTAIAVAALSALTLWLYHPTGPSILLFPFQMGSDSYLAQHLVEFRAPWRFPVTLLAALWVWLAIVATTLLLRMRTLHAALIGLVLCYVLLTLRFARMAYALGVVSAPIVAAAWSRVPPDALARARSAVRQLALVSLLLLAPFYVFRDHTPGFGYSPTVWPLPCFSAMQKLGLRGNTYVSNAWSGPFLGMFYPARKSFFDARLEAYSPAFVHDVYQSIAYGRPGWDEKLDRYDVQVALLRYTSPSEAHLQHRVPNLRQKLALDPRWSLVRFDDYGELFVRTSGLNAEVAARDGIPCVDPDRRQFLSRPRECADALLHATESGNRAQTLLMMAAIASADAGKMALALELSAEGVRADPGDAWAQGVQRAIRRAQP